MSTQSDWQFHPKYQRIYRDFEREGQCYRQYDNDRGELIPIPLRTESSIQQPRIEDKLGSGVELPQGPKSERPRNPRIKHPREPRTEHPRQPTQQKTIDPSKSQYYSSGFLPQRDQPPSTQTVAWEERDPYNHPVPTPLSISGTTIERRGLLDTDLEESYGANAVPQDPDKEPLGGSGRLAQYPQTSPQSQTSESENPDSLRFRDFSFNHPLLQSSQPSISSANDAADDVFESTTFNIGTSFQSSYTTHTTPNTQPQQHTVHDLENNTTAAETKNQDLYVISDESDEGFLPDSAGIDDPIARPPWNSIVGRNTTSSEPLNGQLDSRYKVIHKARAFFKIGRVFSMLWAEPAGQRTNHSNSRSLSQGRFGQSVMSEIRRFVVIRENTHHCICMSISTYGGQATTKPGTSPKDHAIVYMKTQKRPSRLPAETQMTKQPFAVLPADDNQRLDPLSRINFAKLYTVEHNVKVMNIGKIVPEQIARLESYFNELMGLGGLGPPANPAKD